MNSQTFVTIYLYINGKENIDRKSIFNRLTTREIGKYLACSEILKYEIQTKSLLILLSTDYLVKSKYPIGSYTALRVATWGTFLIQGTFSITFSVGCGIFFVSHRFKFLASLI